jgi:hypothetical protein
MSRRPLLFLMTTAALATAFAPTDASAQSANSREVTASASITGVNTFNTDLDQGGNFSWASGIVSGTLSRQFSPDLNVGMTFRYDYESWKFGSPVAFGGNAPWSSLNAPNIAVNFSYAYAPDLRFDVTPTIGWSYETGATANNVLVYGAILSATKIFSPSLVLGFGAGVVRQIDETKVFPFLIVHWQIDDKWLLANPFTAGPAGGAGLELSYTLDHNWELAGGGAYRSYRFRLSNTAPTPNGVGENRFIPLFARVTRKLGPKTHLDLYAGLGVAGRLSVDNSNGDGVARDDYNTAPVIGLTLAHTF